MERASSRQPEAATSHSRDRRRSEALLRPQLPGFVSAEMASTTFVNVSLGALFGTRHPDPPLLRFGLPHHTKLKTAPYWMGCNRTSLGSFVAVETGIIEGIILSR